MMMEREIAGRRFILAVKDILGAPVDCIVNPANSGLSHGAGLAAQIANEAGPAFENECREIITRIGQIPVSRAVPTGAGRLPYKGIINVVGPRMTQDDVQQKLEAAVMNCMVIADLKGWQSIAFPAISTGIFGVPKEICANAFKKALPQFYANNPQSPVNLVWLCVITSDYPVFEKILKSS